MMPEVMIERQDIIDRTTAAYEIRKGPVKIYDLLRNQGGRVGNDYWVVTRYVEQVPGIFYHQHKLSTSLEEDINQLLKLNFGPLS